MDCEDFNGAGPTAVNPDARNMFCDECRKGFPFESMFAMVDSNTKEFHQPMGGDLDKAVNAVGHLLDSVPFARASCVLVCVS